VKPKNWLRTQADDAESPDFALDHSGPWGGFADSKFAGSEIAAEEAMIDASNATGVDFQANMSDEDFQFAVVEGESWEDEEGSWLS